MQDRRLRGRIRAPPRSGRSRPAPCDLVPDDVRQRALAPERYVGRVAVGAQSSTFPDPLFSSGAFLIMPRSIFDLGVQNLIDGSTFDLKSIAGKPALAMNVASR